MQNLDHPELVITWGSEFPDKLKIRKEVTLWPLRFKLRADYTRTLRAFEYGCSCKAMNAQLMAGLGCCKLSQMCVQLQKAFSEFNHRVLNAVAWHAGHSVWWQNKSGCRQERN